MKKIIAGLIILFVLFTPFSTVVSTVKILFFLGLLYLFIRYVLPKLIDIYDEIKWKQTESEAKGSFDVDVQRLEKLLNEKKSSYIKELEVSELKKAGAKVLIEHGGNLENIDSFYSESLEEHISTALRNEFLLEPEDISTFAPIIDIFKSDVANYINDDNFREKWNETLFSVGANELFYNRQDYRDSQGEIYHIEIRHKWKQERPDIIRGYGVLALLSGKFDIEEIITDDGRSRYLDLEAISEIKESLFDVLCNPLGEVLLFADNKLYYGEFSGDSLVKSEIIHYNQIKHVVIEENLLRISYTGGKLSLLLDDEGEKNTARGLRSLIDAHLEEK